MLFAAEIQQAKELLDTGATPAGGTTLRPGDPVPEGERWVLFVGTMLMLVAILNVIHGIAAIGNSSFFADDTKYILSDLNNGGQRLVARS